LRIIKSNTVSYEAFNQSLPYLTKTVKAHGDATFVDLKEEKEKFLNKYFAILQSLLAFEKYVKSSKDFQQAASYFGVLLKNILSFKEANIFLFDEHKTNLIPLSSAVSEHMKHFVNRAYAENKLDEIFKHGKPKIILDSLVLDINGSKSYYLFLPIFEENKTKGLFAILTPHASFSDKSLEIPLIQLGLSILLNKADQILKQNELKNIYNELNVYQSKLANDYKLSAIGELASGVVEDILGPLQVISSTAELIRNDENNIDKSFLDTINNQVEKIKSTVDVLVNYTDTTDSKLKIQPCNLNELVKNYYDITLSSLQNDNYECVLDIEENIPSILSHPNYIKQLLSYVFSIIRVKGSLGGGIFLQTKYQKEKILLRILSTDFVPNLKNYNNVKSSDVNLRIINNIMTKHDGLVNIDSDKLNGTSVQLIFPLKRTISK
jgi:K+-sensing histidine kinase KdpD